MQRRSAAFVLSTLVFASPSLGVTLRVGTDSACQASSLAAAIAMLPADGPGVEHRLEVARNAVHQQPLAIVQRSVVVVGGYDTCSDPLADPTTPTQIGPVSGTSRILAVSGGTAGARFRVTLQNLVFDGGTSGGLSLTDRVQVRLLDSRVQRSGAANGAGVLIDGDASATIDERTLLLLDGNSRIENNLTSGLGGGVFCSDQGEIALRGRDAGIVGNRASNGGGLFLVRCILRVENTEPSATFGISANRASAAGGGIFALESGLSFDAPGIGALLSNNQAQGGSGGGLFASGSEIIAFGLAVSANTASLDGGGLALTGGTTMFAERYAINANSAGADGGGLLVDNASFLRLDDPRPCADTACRTIRFNTAGALTDAVGGGAIAARRNAALSLSEVRIDDNEGPRSSAISLDTSTLELRNATLRGNRLGQLGQAILVAGSILNLTHVTASANAIDNRQEALIRAGGPSTVGVHNSILHEAFGSVFASVGAPAIGGRCLIVHESTSSAGTPLQNLLVADPRLTSVADFRLRPNSPAIDRCAAPPVAFATDRDIQGFVRPVDDGGVINIAGNWDAGAHERLSAPVDPLFGDGFE